MKILIACEESQTVCKAFREKGHEAYSCDFQQTSGSHPEWHLKGDVLGHLNDGWDLMIGHPPCTYLTVTANKWLKDQPARKSGALVGAERREAQKKASDFFLKLYNVNIPNICIENPVGIMSSTFRKPDQIIQPWQFGHREPKKTCLWLKNLPKLKHTNIVEPEYEYANGKRYSKTHFNNTPLRGRELSRVRSKTYAGIADAMANQWG